MASKIESKAEIKENGKNIEKSEIDKNYDLVFEYQPEINRVLAEVDCLLKDKNGRVILDFKEFLPPDCQFIRFLPPEPVIWGAIRDERGREMISVGYLNDAKQIVSLLHEIGHSHQKELRLKRNQIMEEIKAIEQEIDKSIDDFNVLSDKQNKELIKMKIKELEIKQKELNKEKLQLKAKIERGAWAYALKKIRQVREDKKIDLLKPFKNFDELKKYINSALGTYATQSLMANEKEIANMFTKEIPSKEEQNKFRQIRKSH